jgi:DNA-binding NtrC family response regulator
MLAAVGASSPDEEPEAANNTRDAAATEPPAADLDTAVALLELGGHPHILAREAVAVIDAAGCARALALVAQGAHASRVIEARGWDDRQAAAAARAPDAYDVIPLGRYRDEPWQLVVEPRPELEHRCTLIAIRKLIATSLGLDRYRREEKQRASLWPAEALDGDPESIWASEQMSEVLSVARRIAPTPLSLLLTGETGTGKEMLARAIHRASDRADRPLLPFNCTAVPRDMLESQLFGYRKGAFTGADTSFPGVIRSAAGGTLFLDEIADVSLDVQPKLLRFLETHEIHPLGEPHPVTVDVRVIAATNARLEQLVAEGKFREDLFYRLNVVRLKLPPLRERREEIPPLVNHYVRKYGDEQKKGRLTLGDETLEYLLLYAWPGNLRQLANEVRRMVAMAEPNGTLTPALLSPEIQASRRTIPAAAAIDPEVRVRIDQPLPAAVELLEQTMVRSALDRSHGRVEQAARLLGISRKGLFLKRRRWGLHQAS